MPTQLTHATFAPLVGKRFLALVSEAQQIEIELLETQPLPVHARHGGQAPPRESFSLIFRGPMRSVMSQRLYALEQEAVGQVEIFLVPIGPDAVGQRYEAVFN